MWTPVVECYSFRNQDLRAAEHIAVLDRRAFLVSVERLAPSSSASSWESRHPDDAIEVVYQYMQAHFGSDARICSRGGTART
jgi:hypothetical protein